MTDEEIERFIRRFEDTSLPHSEWTHGKHLIVALVYLARHPRDEATERIRHGIQRLNHRYDNPNGYHETITLAWIEVVSRFLERRPRGEPCPTCPASCWPHAISRITCSASTRRQS